MKVFRRSSTQENLRSYKESRKAFKELCRDKQQSWQKQCREGLINSRNYNNLFWKKIKSFRNKPKHEFDISDKQWFDHFRSLLYSDGVKKLNTKIHVHYDDESINDTFNRPFTEDELKASISALKNGKASGPDGVIAEMIKSTRVKISPILFYYYCITRYCRVEIFQTNGRVASFVRYSNRGHYWTQVTLGGGRFLN